MNTILKASMAVLALAIATPAFAQGTVDANASIGATGGGAGGAALGFVVGGPIGAIVGGFAGAMLGAEAGIAATTVDFAAAHPVEPIYIDGADLGFVVPADVTIHPVEGDTQYGYVYANNRVWIVDLQSRALVQSPGYLVPQTAADYAIGNPVTSAAVEGDVVVGYVVPEGVELVAVPEDPTYSYVYVNDRPALVDNSTRAIVWIN